MIARATQSAYRSTNQPLLGDRGEGARGGRVIGGAAAQQFHRAARQRGLERDRTQVGVRAGDRIGQHGAECAAAGEFDERADRVRFDRDARRDTAVGETVVDVGARREVAAEQRQGLDGEIPDRQRPRVGGQGVVGADHQAQVLGEQGSAVDTRGVGAAERDTQVEGVGEQVLFEPVLRGLGDRDGDLRMRPVEPVHQRADEVGGDRRRHRHAQVPSGQILHIVDGTFARLEVAQRSARVLGVHLTGVGEAHRPPGAVEQLHTQQPLELFDLLRQRRLGDVQRLGGPGEVPVVGDGEQVPDMTQLHGHQNR